MTKKIDRSKIFFLNFIIDETTFQLKDYVNYSEYERTKTSVKLLKFMHSIKL